MTTIRSAAKSPRVLAAARGGIHALRAADDIGDDAFRRIEQELDWLEMALGDESAS